MDTLSAYAGELDALVGAGRRIRLGDRNPERPYADLDALLGNLQALANRMRHGAPANDQPAHVGRAVVTGVGQIIHVVGRRRGR